GCEALTTSTRSRWWEFSLPCSGFGVQGTANSPPSATALRYYNRPGLPRREEWPGGRAEAERFERSRGLSPQRVFQTRAIGQSRRRLPPFIVCRGVVPLYPGGGRRLGPSRPLAVAIMKKR